MGMESEGTVKVSLWLVVCLGLSAHCHAVNVSICSHLYCCSSLLSYRRAERVR